MAASGNGTYDYNAPNASGDLKGYNPDYTSAFGTQNTNSQNFNTAQNNQVGNFTSAYNAAAQAMPSYQSLLNNANAQYGVEPLANKATQLNNTVLQIPQTYSQATQGSDTNNNQLMQLIGQKQWELNPQAQAATNSAQTAQTLANNMVNYGVQNEAQLLSPYANTVPLQQALTSGAYANFTQQQSDQLAALTAKMQSGVQLTTTEMNNLTALQTAKTQADALIAAQKISSQNQNIPAGNTYYNPTTGQYYNPTTKVSAPT